jgi:phage shock protein E
MNTTELHTRIHQGLAPGEVVLDVRDTDEYAEGHIAGALNIPHEQVAAHAHELTQYQRIYIHCGGGGRAGRAVAALQKAGLTNLVHISESGMRTWLEAGYPVVK